MDFGLESSGALVTYRKAFRGGLGCLSLEQRGCWDLAAGLERFGLDLVLESSWLSSFAVLRLSVSSIPLAEQSASSLHPGAPDDVGPVALA